MVLCGAVRCGLAWLGLAWLGLAWLGLAWRSVSVSKSCKTNIFSGILDSFNILYFLTSEKVSGVAPSFSGLSLPSHGLAFPSLDLALPFQGLALRSQGLAITSVGVWFFLLGRLALPSGSWAFPVTSQHLAVRDSRILATRSSAPAARVDGRCHCHLSCSFLPLRPVPLLLSTRRWWGGGVPEPGEEQICTPRPSATHA